jgi:hypothetical protein
MLELPAKGHKITKQLMLAAAYFAQNQPSFKAASEMLQRMYGIYINRETIRQIAEKAGFGVFTEDTKKAASALERIADLEIAESCSKEPITLYIMIDGGLFCTNQKVDGASSWREAKTAIAFTSKDILKRSNNGSIILKKEAIAFVGPSEEFKGYVLSLSIKAGYGRIENIVAIADGAAWIREMCLELFPDATQILDLFHLKENVYNYAKYKFSHNEAEYAPWAKEINSLLENGRADEVLERLPEGEAVPVNVCSLRVYIKNNIDKINYPKKKEKGYFVGSGAIESQIKIIVQRRLKQPGMRWSVPGAQAMLALRVKAESGLWDTEVKAVVCA